MSEQFLTKNKNKQYHHMRSLLRSEIPDSPKETLSVYEKIFIVLFALFFLVGFILMMSSCAYSSEIIIKGYSNSEICEAIRKAENSKTHPYGVMKKFKHTTPKQACLNTIIHQRRNYEANGSQGDFIEYLGLTYSPPDINPHWVGNVRYFLAHPKKGN